MKHAVRNRKGKQRPHVIGFDSETLDGPPITFQFHSEVHKRITGCTFIGKRSPTQVFLKCLEKLPKGRYRMYGHNLEFDMLSALWSARAKIRDGNIDMRIGPWHIKGRYSKPVFAIFSDGKRTIELVDSFLWFMTSLDKAGEKVCPDLPKLLRPKGLGTKLFTPRDTDFVAYADRDAVVAYHLGCAIERFHEELEIPPQISLASMAAAVFKTRYMQTDIYQPPMREWMVGAAAAYHGGVNRILPGAEMTWHMNVTALDLSSAYPDAMRGFPAFSNPNAYQAFALKRGSRTLPPELGIYCISGRASACYWPALFNHKFKPLQGKFSDVWVTGYELRTAIGAGEVTLTALDGYYYDLDREPEDNSPFAGYVDEFYRLKSDAPDPVMRYMYKILLNALTGKFIQTSPDFTLVDGQLVKINRAGGLYHPFIAGLITGHTRSVMHPLEHRYKALHTATDGIFAPGYHKGAAKKELGAVVAEGHGDLALFRNKLYIFYSDKESADTYPSQVFEGRHIMKCARHGFQGTVTDLERMLVNVDRTYNVNKPWKLKTAIKRKKVPNKFEVTSRTLKVGTHFATVHHG